MPIKKKASSAAKLPGLAWNVSCSDLSELTEGSVRIIKKQTEINAANHKVIILFNIFKIPA